MILELADIRIAPDKAAEFDLAIARGVQAHSSTGQGLNANWALIPFMVEMKAIYEKLRFDAAYHDALTTARAEADKIVGAAKADITADLAKATATADADIAKQSAESAKRIDEIRAGAADAVSAVAKDTAAALVAALGGQADAAAITTAVAARLKG